MYRFLVWAVTLTIAWPSLAQETRQELLRQQREEKRARVEPYKLNRVEKEMIRLGVTLILTPRGHCQLRIGTTLSRVVTSAL